MCIILVTDPEGKRIIGDWVINGRIILKLKEQDVRM
jgi:hypothetical protein